MSTLSCILVLAALAALTAALQRPARLRVKLVRNTLGGYLSLLLINLFSFLTGAVFSLNIVTAVLVGFLGLPGIGLLFLARWLVYL